MNTFNSTERDSDDSGKYVQVWNNDFPMPQFNI